MTKEPRTTKTEALEQPVMLDAPSCERSVRSRTTAARLQILEDLGLSKEYAFDELVQLAAALCGAAISTISFFDGEHQWFKAAYGVPSTTIDIKQSICFVAAQRPTLLVVEDLSKDLRFQAFQSVAEKPHLRFYAGLALRDPMGCIVGALCVADTMPRELQRSQRHALEILGKQVEAHIRLRLQERTLQNALAANHTLINKLSQTNDDLKRVLDAVPTIIVGLTRGGYISYWNSAAERTFLLASDAVCGRPLYGCGVQWIAERATLDALQENTAINDRSDHPFLLNGEKRWLGLTVRAVDQLGSDGHTTVLLSGADITNRRLQEEQARQLHKMEAIGQLAAGIAHEINTPTQYVGNNIDFVQRAMTDVLATMESVKSLRNDYKERCGETDALNTFDERLNGWDSDFVLSEIPYALSQAFDGTKRIGSIVKAMREFSHPGSEEKTTCDLNHAIDLTVLIARSEWKYAATLHTRLASDLPQVLCYPGEINQVLLNLIVNATHAIQERAALDPSAGPGLISISTKQIDEWVEVCVEDNGIGIPAEIQTRVFELFFTTKDVGKGTGQGLAFAHSVIVKKHGGHLWFDSERFQGTSFYLRLPSVGYIAPSSPV